MPAVAAVKIVPGGQITSNGRKPRVRAGFVRVRDGLRRPCERRRRGRCACSSPGPGTCGWVPVKSATTRSPSISTRTRIGNGPLPSPVLVDVILGLEHAARRTPDGGSGECLAAARAPRAIASVIVVDAVPAADLEQPAFGDLQTGRERGEIADRHFGQAAVRADDGDQIVVELAASNHADERKLQALLEDLDRVGGPRTGILPTDASVQWPFAAANATSSRRPRRSAGPSRRRTGRPPPPAKGSFVAATSPGARSGMWTRVSRTALARGTEEPRDAVALRDELAARVGEADGESRVTS